MQHQHWKNQTEEIQGKVNVFLKALSQVLFIHYICIVCSYQHKSDYIIVCISQHEYYMQDLQLV